MSAAVCVTVCVRPRNARVDQDLASAVLQLRPTLAEHSCMHRGFGYFGDKLLGSTLPHLVEHLAIDMLVEQAGGTVECQGLRHAGYGASQLGGVGRRGDGQGAGQGGGDVHAGGGQYAGKRQPIAGNTRWLDKQNGVMGIMVSCTAESAEASCTAIKDAVELVNSLSTG